MGNNQMQSRRLDMKKCSKSKVKEYRPLNMVEKTLCMLKGEPAQETMVSALTREEPFHHVEVVTCDLKF